MPNYRLEAWISYPDDDAEDFLEERISDLLCAAGMRPQMGPVVYRLFFRNDQVRDR